jgi:ubiquinone/menaquinone biosynthesis C-methylase UbiE
VKRFPEPELMEDDLQAEAYAKADFVEPNCLFCENLLSRLHPPERARVVDLGCGPADIPVRLARARPSWILDVVDGSPAMLRHARERIENEGLSGRIRTHCQVVPAPALRQAAYDIVISNSLLHHMPEPGVFWKEIVRLARTGGMVAVMDLMRPASRAVARALVERYSGAEPEVLKRDFFASLLAAFTPREVEEQLRQCDIGNLKVEIISDRHLFAFGSIE